MDNTFGNLFFVGFQKNINTSLLEKINPAGIILYPENMKDVSSLQLSMERIYSLFDKGYKFFISSDHEGGQLETVPNVFPSPGNLAFGMEGGARLYGNYLGNLLSLHGFNTLFAPVVDVKYSFSSHVTGFRAFSSDHEIVEKASRDFIEGLSEYGIAATLKHFPGHGRAVSDSHFVLPIVEDFDENDRDVLVFRKLANCADFIMTAHVVYPDVDDVIATLSKRWLHEVLREDFGFDGLILSDAFEMGALKKYYSPREAIRKFFEADGDIILISDVENNLEIIETFYSMVETGELDRDLLNEKSKKVERIKNKYVKNTYPARFLSDTSKKVIKANILSPVLEPSFVIPTPQNLSLADTTERDLKSIRELILTEFPNSHVYYEDEAIKMSFIGPVVYFVLDGVKNIDAKRIIYVFLRKFDDETENNYSEFVIPYSSKLISVYHVLQLIKREGAV